MPNSKEAQNPPSVDVPAAVKPSQPGYLRLLVFLVAGCTVVSFGVAIWLMAMEGAIFPNTLLFGIIGFAFATPVAYLLVYLFRGYLWMLEWVRSAYEPRQWADLGRLLSVMTVIGLLLLGASLYRFEIVAGHASHDRFYYLLWDRWTGHVEAKGAPYKGVDLIKQRDPPV